MKFSIYGLVLIGFLVSCKSDVKDQSEGVDTTDTIVEVEATSTPPPRKVPPKKDLNEMEKNQVNSIMTKMMLNLDVKTFTSMMVSAEMTEKLSTEDGPFTVFAPDSRAFNDFPQDRINMMVNPNNRDQLVSFINGHIVEGLYDLARISEELEINTSLKLQTIAGSELTVQSSGDGVSISDAQGNTVTVLEADIIGYNGVVHTLDGALENN